MTDPTYGWGGIDLHEHHWPGPEPHAMAPRLMAHQGAEHQMSTSLKRAGDEVARATLSCTCGGTLVIIDYPSDVEVKRLVSAGPLLR